MKNIIGIIFTLVAVNSFAGKIPEAKSLHPELYTIQFTFVNFPTSDGLKMGEEEERIMEAYANLLEELEDEEDREQACLSYAIEMRKAKINRIESSETEYTELATIYTRTGEPFPEAYSNVVKGLFDAESNTLAFSEFKSVYIHVSNSCSYDNICVGEWIATIARVGADNNGTLLIKCYPPTNVSSSQPSEGIRQRQN